MKPSLPLYKKIHKKFKIMAHMYELTPKELQDIIAYVRDDDTQVLDTGAVERFTNLASALSRKLLEDTRHLSKANGTMRRRLDRYEAREQAAIDSEGFPSLDFDSLDIASALLYQLQQLKTYRLTPEKLNLILYGMYASWLAGKRQRLFLEHPQATPWGPRFWRVFKRISDVNLRVPYELWQNLTEKDTAVAGFIKRYAEKYYDTKEKDLLDFFKKSKPYKNATADKNGGKWNKEIPDSEIFAWKTEKK